MEEVQNRTNHEIDVIGLAKKILKEKKLLSLFILVFAILGVIVALSKPKQYTSEAILAPEMSAGGLGMSESLADMASTFGFDLGSKSSYDAIYPEIYPEVFASSDFIMGLTDVPVRTIDNPATTKYLKHLVMDAKFPFWDYPKIWLSQLLKPKKSSTGGSDEESPYLTKEQNEICDIIRSGISCEVSSKTSLITIKIKDQDPLVATIIVDTVQKRLQEYITTYRTQKARNDVDYYQKLYAESKQQYLKAQQLYASYSDTNQELQLAAFRAKQEELENEMQLRYNTYTQMAAQLQAAKAKVQERTPAFTVIQRATIPYKPSSTPRSLIVFFFIALGVVADGLWVLFVRDFIKKR